LMVKKLALHDVGAAGCVHTIAGFFALAVCINLGPRVGRYTSDGKIVDLPAHNMPLTLVGLMTIIVGFFGFLGGCIIFMGGEQWVNIYGQPATLSAFAFNTLMGFAGGIIGAYFMTKDPFWMMSGALAGIFAAASGLDVYYPPLAFCLGFVGGIIVPLAGNALAKLGIDDAVGAWAVHGVGGVWGLTAAGLFASGYPNIDAPAVSLSGQLISAAVFAAMGFIPGYLVSFLLKGVKLLRVPDEAQLLGLDSVKVPIPSYPEFTTHHGNVKPAE